MSKYNITISRIFGSHPHIRIAVGDNTSGITLMVAQMSFSDFAEAVTGHGFMDLNITHWMPLSSVEKGGDK